MTWFKRQPQELDTSGEKKVKTEGLWVKCDQCRQIIWKKDLDENFNVCPKCDKHFRIDARTRLSHLLDDGSYTTEDDNLVSTDPLKFVDLKAYSDRLKAAQKSTGLKDAIINARGKINGRDVIVSAMEYSFIGGSMGAVVGEAITRAIEKATDETTDHCRVLRRRTHDGRRDQPDDPCENLVSAGAYGRCQSAVCLPVD
jgi:acetyl-CoA carboxylase carboxyl transferase subunit beta